MVEAKRRVEIVGALRKHGAYKVDERGGHEKWRCSCGEAHQTQVPRHRQITTSTTNRIYKQMIGCPHFGEEWLR